MTNQLAGQVSMFDLVSPFGRTCPEHIQATKDATSKPSCKPSAKSQTPTFMFLSLRGGKWQKAGCIVGEGYSVAWRTLDAQYFPRTPQRRKRIYLVADFGSECAGEILFKPHSVRGNPAEGGKEGKGTAEDVEGGAGRSGGDGIGLFHLQQDPISSEKVSPCIGGQRQATIGVFMGGQGDKAGGIGYSDSVSPTLKSVLSGGNTIPDVVYALQGNGIDRADTAGCNGCGWRIGGGTPSTRSTDMRWCIDEMKVYENYGFAKWREGVGTIRASGGDLSGGSEMLCVGLSRERSGGVAPTLTGDHQNRVTDYTAIAVHPKTTGALCANSHPGSYTGQDAFNDMLPVVPSDKPPRKYIVRRLTPLECCRLQGYPDGWTENLETAEQTEEEIAFFTEVWARWAAINGTKPKSRAQVIKWLKDPGSDSAEYKAYGNSLAIPCSSDVLGRIAAFMEEEEDGSE